MGLYIPNMEMPEDGCHHIICIYADGTVATGRREYRAIPVPPHGRLIDADEMFVEFVTEGQRSKRYKIGEKWELNGEEIRSVISRLSTIIPAEDGK